MTGTYFDMPDGMYPVHLFHRDFITLGQWFPAKDAWVLEYICRQASPDHALEIGSFVGCTATILAGHFRNVLCVDTWTGSPGLDQINNLYHQFNVRQAFLDNTASISHIESFVRDMTADTLPEELERRDVKYDLIFIDAAHDSESVRRDIEIAQEWISPGGIICGHDYSFFPGVTEAVNEWGFDGAMGTIWWREMP